MTKRWSSVRSDLVTTKRAASKRDRLTDAALAGMALEEYEIEGGCSLDELKAALLNTKSEKELA